ncbi:uncharacterized protein TM35_000121840 [Trypanosoma theileri]|uniref:Uncharacterized protein n=1 Tax=Trypanosoma theileri TaxID=67003 RepID=A0A1X0NYX1_9TRYP|nr:uncharacterized protein TM35_000121840 [Trypanosoma theileri]ORC89409.1 hypothetical protein TM35_000121840 [Trypanosoma theileri]
MAQWHSLRYCGALHHPRSHNPTPRSLDPRTAEYPPENHTTMADQNPISAKTKQRLGQKGPRQLSTHPGWRHHDGPRTHKQRERGHQEENRTDQIQKETIQSTNTHTQTYIVSPVILTSMAILLTIPVGNSAFTEAPTP